MSLKSSLSKSTKSTKLTKLLPSPLIQQSMYSNILVPFKFHSQLVDEFWKTLQLTFYCNKNDTEKVYFRKRAIFQIKFLYFICLYECFKYTSCYLLPLSFVARFALFDAFFFISHQKDFNVVCALIYLVGYYFTKKMYLNADYLKFAHIIYRVIVLKKDDYFLQKQILKRWKLVTVVGYLNTLLTYYFYVYQFFWSVAGNF